MPAVKINVTKFSKSKQNTQPVVAATTEEPIVAVEQTTIEPIVEATQEANDDMPDFLDALTNDKYVNKKQQQEEAKQKELDSKERDKQRKEQLRQMKEFEKAKIAEEKAAKKRKPEIAIDDNISVCSNDIFSSNNHSLIIGKEKRVLLNKVQSYKELFKEELKGFKIKKNCSTDELKEYIAEMDCIIETGTVETFMSDSIYSCIKIIEGISVNTKKYDVSGLSVLLQHNKQFNTLLKQLFLKYKVFSNVPPEYQIVLIVATSAYICRNKNLNKDSLNAFFNEPILVPEN
jgi:hypothetical protein